MFTMNPMTIFYVSLYSIMQVQLSLGLQLLFIMRYVLFLLAKHFLRCQIDRISKRCKNIKTTLSQMFLGLCKLFTPTQI